MIYDDLLDFQGALRLVHADVVLFGTFVSTYEPRTSILAWRQREFGATHELWHVNDLPGKLQRARLTRRTSYYGISL